MKIKTLVLGMVSTNCYVVSNEETKEALIIDPGDEAEYVKAYLEKENLTPAAILLTHGHFDHIMAVNELVDEYSVRVYAHAKEQELLKEPTLNCSDQVGRPYYILAPEMLEDNSVLTIAGFQIKVIYTPGHTIGCVCYYFEEEKVLFSGDTIFMESVGRTDLPTGSARTLMESIREKIIPLQNEVKVYPGHGEATTIGAEKKYNQYFRD